jgi:hypothetical protein
MRSILDTVSLAQRYDINLMLCVLPHVLFFAITAPETAATDGLASIQPDGEAARVAVLEEIGAVTAQCFPGENLQQAGAVGSMPSAALHLQAIMTALDSLQRCVPSLRCLVA